MGHNFLNEGGYDRRGVSGVGGGGDRWRHRNAIMEMRGRNGKWLRAWNGGTVGKVGLVVVFELCSRIGKCGQKGNAFVVISVIKLSA